jgi:sn-glycerol 3-phosphate transport system substrate-binding protein
MKTNRHSRNADPFPELIPERLPGAGRGRIGKFVVFLAAIALFAGACGSGDGDDNGSGSASGSDGSECPVDALDDADGPVEITVWSNFNALPRRTFEAMVDEYNTSQDRVVVNFQPQGIAFEEVLRKYKLAAEDDSLPSLVLLEDTTTQVMADSGTIIPGEACFDADPEGEAIKDDFLPIATASYSVEDQLLPVGFDVYTALVFYNRDTFVAAGLDPDVPPATLDDVRAAAQEIKDSGAGDKPVSVLAAPWQMEWWLTGVGQPIVNENNGRAGLAEASEFDNESTHELFDFWRGMVSDGLATGYPGIEGQTNHLFAMATGGASIVIESSAAVNTIAGLLEGTVDEALIEELGVDLPPDFAGLDLDIGVGEFPGLEEPGKGQIGGGAWYLTNSGTPEQQAASWDFMKWFNATAQQVRWASDGSGLPVTQSALDDPGLQQTWADSLGGRWNTVAMEVLQNVDPDFPGPLIGDYKATREAIREAQEATLLTESSVDEAIATADSKITAAAEEYKATVGG